MSMMRCQWIREGFVSLADSLVPGLTGGIICRTRYIDDVIQHCVDNGVTSVINLGAGLDTRGLRLSSLLRVKYCEIDHADIVRYKQRKIVQFQRKIPQHLRLFNPTILSQSGDG